MLRVLGQRVCLGVPRKRWTRCERGLLGIEGSERDRWRWALARHPLMSGPAIRGRSAVCRGPGRLVVNCSPRADPDPVRDL